MPNAIEQIYDQLVQVFGGTNSNQIFTMLMPGTTLDAKNYAFDTTRMKPATVQDAESKLVDQMFDIAKVTGSSNGMKVSSQYQQALSVLVPQFNPIMPVLKKTLRDFLNGPVNAVGDDGQPIKGTLQEYYFKLYDAWIVAKLAWEKKILDKKAELAKNPETENELFLEWYEQTAEGELANVDEKMAKVLGVFAPSDMDAILGALASGPGGEIEEAMQTVNDIRLASPNGGYIYPVELLPDDWFLDLASDIDPVNLLKDPAFIATSIQVKRQALMASIGQIQAMINQMPLQGEIKKATDNLQAVQKTYVDAQNNLVSTYTDNTVTAINMYLSKYSGGLAGPGNLVELNQNVTDVAKAKGDNADTTAKKRGGTALTADDIKALADGQKKLIDAQSALLTSAQKVADAGLNLASTEASYFGDLPYILTRLQSQLAEMQTMQDQLSSSIVAKTNGISTIIEPASGKGVNSVAKSETSQRFMELQFSFSAEDMSTNSSSDASFSQTSWGVDLFFGSASGSSSSSSAMSSKDAFDSSKEIKIGLKAAKVDIQRGWFDPGVFKLTGTMGKMAGASISLGNLIDEPDLAKHNSALLPGYPVVFLVVKDVTIAFQASSSHLSTFQSVIDSRSACGGGFLCFSASSSSSSHQDTSSISSKSDGTVININMPGPQILGWFLEMTPKDNSTIMIFDPAADKPRTDVISAKEQEISIISFVNRLAELNKQ
ncbi:MAG: hypothetical protein LWX56_01855 [Ignavibacteria bacterium]|nr:hypothetical protein [Ignavibacteria bacterium]